MRHLKWIPLILVIAIAMILTLQNTEQARIDFLVWHIEAPQILVLSFVFAVGLLLGFIVRGRKSAAHLPKDPATGELT